MSLDDLRDAIRPDDPHYVRTRLVCLENTHNRAGGRVHPMESVAAIARWAHGHNLLMHLDGARLMNAVVASGRPAPEWAQHFDTVSICFSKGLGAPVGSALAGSARGDPPGAPASQALRRRDAAGRASWPRPPSMPSSITSTAWPTITPTPGCWPRRSRTPRASRWNRGPVETNLVWVQVDRSLGTAAEVAAYLRSHGVLVSVLGPQVLRACTHLDVSREQVESAAGLIRQIEPAMVSADDARLLGRRPVPGGCRDGVAARGTASVGPGPRRGPGAPAGAGRAGDHGPSPGPYETIGGADVSFNKWSPTLYAAVVVLRADTLELIDRAGVVAEATFPYVPGLLSFREAPPVIEAFETALGPPRRVALRRPGDRASATARPGVAPGALAGDPHDRLRQVAPVRRVRGARPDARPVEPDDRRRRDDRRRAPHEGSGQAAVRLAGAPLRPGGRHRGRAGRDAPLPAARRRPGWPTTTSTRCGDGAGRELGPASMRRFWQVCS